MSMKSRPSQHRQPTPEQWAAFRSRLDALPQETIEKNLRAERAESDALHAKFIARLAEGHCHMCGKPLATFSGSTLCLHWLLRPKGVKKGHVEEVLSDKGYYRAGSYVRWLSNSEAYLNRINDLANEGNASSVFHWSCSYKHIKWTFLCSESDLAGHHGTNSDFPHFHFEIRLNGQPFIRFNDFHIPFTEEDEFKLRCGRDPRCRVKYSFGAHGAGMQEAFSMPLEDVLAHSRTTEDEGKAVYHMQTMIEDPRGIPGEKIAELIQAARNSGKSIAHHAREAGLPAKIVISPADVVPEKQERNNPRA